MQEKALVVKSNTLVEASHKLGEIEQRLVLLAIYKARSQCITVEQLRGKELTIYADDYADAFGITTKMSYKALKQAVLGLFKEKWGYKYINDKGNVVVAYERFTQSAKYINGEGLVKFTFADAIIPLLVGLEKNYTSYELKQVANLSSGYAMRLYEFFMQFMNKEVGKGWLVMPLNELRFRFGLLPSEYKTMGNFKRRVLDLAVTQINENTDLDVTYTQTKQGRKITGFDFEFKYKKGREPKHAIENNAKVGFDITEMSDKQRAVFADKLSKLTELGERAPEGGSYADFARQIEQDLKDPKRAEFYRPYLDQVGFKPTKFSKPIIEQTKPSSEPKPAKPLAITTSEPPQTIKATPTPIEPYSEPTQPPSRMPPQPPPYYYEQELDYYEQGIETYYDTELPKRRTTITDVFKSYSDNEQAIIKKTTLAFIDRFNINADEATAVKKKAIIEAWGVRREPPSDYNPYYYNPYHDPY